MLAGSRTRRRMLGSGVAALALLGGRARAQDATALAADDPPTLIDTEPDIADSVIAPVMLNGLGPFRFLVDTGANASCLSQALADKLMLPAGDPVRVHTIVGPRLRLSVVIDHLEIGTRVRRKVRAPVLPMEAFGVDGVLGIDWLKGQRLVFGFAARTLEITRSRAEVAVPGQVLVPARRKSGQLTIVDADLSGRRISAMIDSGSQFSLGNTALRRLVSLADPKAEAQATKVRMLSIAGESFSGDQLFLPFIRLGGLTMGNAPAIFADMPVFKLWDLHESPTLMLGIDLLAQFTTVALDFGRSSVRFDLAEPPPAREV